MLVKNLIYILPLIIIIMAIPILIWSIKNKNKSNLKFIIFISILYNIYLFVILMVIPNLLSISIQLEILIFYLLALIAGIIYVLSIIISLTKYKKTKTNKTSKKILLITFILIIFPVIIFSFAIIKEKVLISNSDLVLIFHYSGNGGFGDGGDFGYTINEDYCKEFSIGVDVNGYNIEKFLPKTAIEVESLKDLPKYEISLNEFDNKIEIQKNGKIIYNKKINSSYSNISLEKIFYLE